LEVENLWTRGRGRRKVIPKEKEKGKIFVKESRYKKLHERTREEKIPVWEGAAEVKKELVCRLK